MKTHTQTHQDRIFHVLQLKVVAVTPTKLPSNTTQHPPPTVIRGSSTPFTPRWPCPLTFCRLKQLNYLQSPGQSFYAAAAAPVSRKTSCSTREKEGREWWKGGRGREFPRKPLTFLHHFPMPARKCISLMKNAEQQKRCATARLFGKLMTKAARKQRGMENVFKAAELWKFHQRTGIA